MWTQVWPPRLLTALRDSSHSGPKPLGSRRINASRQGCRDQIHFTFTESSNPPLWHLTLIYNLGDDNKYSNQTLPLWLCFLSPLAQRLCPAEGGAQLALPSSCLCFHFHTWKYGMAKMTQSRWHFLNSGQIGALRVDTFESQSCGVSGHEPANVLPSGGGHCS